MAGDTFNPHEGTREVRDVTGNAKSVEIFPEPGAHVAVGVIVASSNIAAIKTKLLEILALADVCTFADPEKRMVWTASALEGKRARVLTSVVVERTAEMES